MIRKISTNKKGFSLLEMMVAVSLFVIIILAATNIFQLVVEGQRSAMAAQNVQTNLQFVFEVISKEIRNAKRDVNSKCSSYILDNSKVYYLDLENKLNFMNQYGECIQYYLDNVNKTLKVHNYNPDTLAEFDVPITPNEIEVSNLKFNVSDDLANNLQPRVTVRMTVKAKGKVEHQQTMEMQTTISARYYKE